MKRLVVLATGTFGSPKKWNPLLERLSKEDLLEGSDWLIFNHCGLWDFRAFRKFFTKSIELLSLELKAKIEQYYLAALANGEPYDDIIFIGHSFGGLMVRQAYLLATGAYAGTVKSQVPWTDKVSRFVLIASTNRGFEPDNVLISALVNLSSATGFLPILRDGVQGSAFVTNLRISWIRYITSLEGREPVMIQLLGTEDGVVRREDSIDLRQFPNGVQFDVSGANHDNLYRPQGRGSEAHEEWELRYKLLLWAILRCDPKKPEQIPSALQESVTVDQGESYTESKTVFIVHGIRDGNSGWVSQLADQISRRANGNLAVVRSNYGYFSAFNFFFPWLRRQNIRWFQDQYSYRFALNPKAEFYFIGHSNGTYVLGESLKRVSAMKFKRIYLAGSVLPREYPWQERFDLDQVKELRNDRSCSDWPVGILCSGLRGLGMKDIGTGGFDGFNFADNRTEEVYYYKGGHGEPLEKENQSSILAFTLDGDRSHPSNLLESTQISSKFQWFSLMAPYFAPLLLLLVFCIASLWGWWIFQDFMWNNLEFWIKFIMSAAILYFVYAFAKTG
ncbi:MAG: alpha/beta hydrolase [Pseudanabaena sp. CAN_BIN31]|nr:alpha/beta hydrolase [Pseudanabaena sp. CAN_BIN31]